jgi:hypothetical protein
MTNHERPDQMACDGLSNTSQHPFNESSSPPSPTVKPLLSMGLLRCIRTLPNEACSSQTPMFLYRL